MRFASDIQPDVRQDPIDQYLGALANAKSYMDQNMPRIHSGISQIWVNKYLMEYLRT
jgi:hypothetical protein